MFCSNYIKQNNRYNLLKKYIIIELRKDNGKGKERRVQKLKYYASILLAEADESPEEGKKQPFSCFYYMCAYILSQSFVY